MAEKPVTLYDLVLKSFEEVEALLLAKPELKTVKDTNERFLLHWAALHGNERLVELILSTNETQVNAVDDTVATPLILATLGGHSNVVKMLIESGANINHKNKGGHSSLQYACSKEKINIVDYLLQHGAELNITDEIGDTPLHRLASNGNIDILNILLKNKPSPNINQQNKYGNTALYIACEEDLNAFALALIDAGASIEILNRDKQSPLDIAKPGLRRQIKQKLNIED